MGLSTAQPKRRAARLATALAVLALAAAALAPAAGAVPAKFWGVVPQAFPTAPQLQRLRGGGVDSIRLPIAWEAIQTSRGGGFDWGGTDAQVEAAARAGLEVLPFLYGAPRWAVHPAPVPGTGGRSKAPAHLPAAGAAGTAWKQFLGAAVRRYGPRGSFWAENPRVPPRPIRTWQIWNEENFKYFVAHPNPAEYGRLVKLSYAAIHGADRGATIVLGGLFARPIEATFARRPLLAYFAADFLARMYRATPGIRTKFDGVALHPYSGSYPMLAPEIEEVRATLAANRDTGKGLWITELGWSSEPPSRGDSFAKGRNGQAAQLRGAFKLLRRNQARWRLRQVYWFSVDDQPGSCNFCGGSGLFAKGFRAKPAWRAYVGFAGGRAG